MKTYIDTIDPSLPEVTAHAVKYLLAFDQVLELVEQVEEHSRGLRQETERSIAAATAISERCENLLRLLEEHITSLEERTAEHEDLRRVLMEQTAALGALEQRLPDPKRVRHEILGDLWQVMEPFVIELVAKIGDELEAQANAAGAKLAEAAELGFMAPVQPEKGAPLRARLCYCRDRLVYRVKKFAADWLVVAQLVGLAALVCITFLAHALTVQLASRGGL